MPRLLTAVVALALTAAAAPAQVVAPAAGSAGAPAATVRSTPLVTAPELMSHIGYLASDALAGRRAGTPGAERAALYVVKAFQNAGVEPPAEYPTYLQAFDFPVGVELGPENRLVLQHGGRLATIFEPGRDFLPLAGSLSERVIQPVVFVGYGISAPAIGYDDYAGVDVRDKIVLALRFSPVGDDPGGRFGRYLSERYKAATARAKGAQAILFVTGPATDELDRLMPFDVDEKPGAMGIVALSATQAVGRAIAATAGGDLSAWQRKIDETGRPASRVLQEAVLNLRADLRARTRTTHNVIGVVPGTDPRLAREAVVVGAHYDGLGLGGAGSLDPVPGEIHNGADDNASGVSAVIELAQYFAYPTNRPRRTTVFVAFGAEEEGMLGSATFVARPPVPLANVVAMVNMDMIGRLNGDLIVYGVGSSRSWPEILDAANHDIGVPLREMPEGYGPSDHAAFYLRQVPVLAFFTGVHSDYHRATDDVDKINVDGTLQVSRLIQAVVAQLANGSERPRFDPRDYAPGLAAEGGEDEPVLPADPTRVGAVPAPGDGTTGVVIERVEEGSPASAAGLTAGDRVVRVAGRPIETIYDYVVALEELPVDRSARFVVERDGKKVELWVQPRAGGTP